MPFLKRIEAYGFKSFADHVKIVFPVGMVGIVGPNGAGKSNINDAIRWVLGEQSAKSLRGKSTDDFIFQGAKNRDPLNVAEVRLVFDNHDRIFNLDYNEIEIARRTYRGSGENEYYINKSRVRLKDVQDLVMDTGLAKNSLAIITQGNVAFFAEAKPLERRYLFEEAAGVAKYKKRKIESLRKLERTDENLNRVNDIIHEIEKHLGPLKRQADKAKIYVETKEKLADNEIALIVKDVKIANDRLGELNQALAKDEADITSLAAQINKLEADQTTVQQKHYQLSRKINEATTQLSSTFEQLSAYEQQRLTINQNQALVIDDKAKKESLLREITAIKADATTLTAQIEQSKAKIAELTTEKMTGKTKLAELQTSLEQLRLKLQQGHFEKQQLVDRIEHQTNLSRATSTILKHKQALSGIVGTVADLITVPDTYQKAIAAVLGKSLQNIVVKQKQDAIAAINFLKQNQAGVTTFLPLDLMSPRTMHPNDEAAISQIKGYLGTAPSLIEFDKTYNPVISNLLGRTLITEDLPVATKVSQLLATKYTVVALSGDLIRPGGAMVGGFQRQNPNLNLLADHKATLENLTLKLQQLSDVYVKTQAQFHALSEQSQERLETLNATELQLAKQEQGYKDALQRQEFLTQQYETLTHEKLDPNNLKISKADEALINSMQKLKLERAQIETELKANKNLHEKTTLALEELEGKLKQLRRTYNQQKDQSQTLSLEQVTLKSQVATWLSRLAEEYEMTFEYAAEHHNRPIKDEAETRELVSQLRAKINALGSVNVDAIAEYEAENDRYQDLLKQHQQLVAANQQLLTAISEMDQMMVEKFSTTIDDINKVLPETFRALFGAGSASLKYTDPDDLLETGIEILVNPPGKKVININLLSGGEKSLVALSVLFAILKVRPIPLAILDEVEAPLDPANVERFAKYVKGFLSTTQFIIITHRPGTMENCDLLYGVTMQDQGVTKIVNIKLKEAAELAEKAQTDAKKSEKSGE